MTVQERVINDIIKVEGGYVNDPKDSGGETMYGITVEVARKSGYDGPMKDMPKEVAYNIYSAKYWYPNKLEIIETLSEKIAEEMADTGVNQGISAAAKYLQRSLNVLNKEGTLYPDLEVDGKVGQGTIDALKAYLSKRDEIVLLRMLNALQGAFYVDLAERRAKDEAFIYGWFKNRIVI